MNRMTARQAHGRLHLVVFLTGLALYAASGTTVRANPSPAHADHAAKKDADEKARAEFEAGRAAYGNGDYRTAWEHFRQAYLLSKRPQLLYNVGQAADRMGRDQEALKAFRMYLDQKPDAENRREVENRVRALEQRVKAGEMTPAPPPGHTWAEPTQPAGEHASEDGGPEATAGATGAPQPPDPDQPRRTGWYFRGALGLAVIVDAVSNETTNGTVSAVGGALDLAAGYALFDGFVVGGAVMGNFSPAGSQSDDNVEGTIELDGVTMWMLGPMVDWYLTPHHEGFHVQGALMLSSLSIAQPPGRLSTVGVESASGGALVLGTGYEFPLTGDLAWGLLGRISIGRLSEREIDHSALSLALMGSVTWY